MPPLPSRSPRDENLLQPSSSSTSSQRRQVVGPRPSTASIDSRSLRAPSYSSLAPGRISASSSAVAGLSASPENFDLGRIPTGGAYDSQGGAVARLRRVASNISMSEATRKAAPIEMPGGTADGDQPINTRAVEEAAEIPSQATEPAGEPGEASSKRPATPNHLRPEQLARGSARRRTWFGWSASGNDPAEEPQSVQAEENGVDDNVLATLPTPQTNPEAEGTNHVRLEEPASANLTDESAPMRKGGSWLGWIPGGNRQGSERGVQDAEGKAALVPTADDQTAGDSNPAPTVGTQAANNVVETAEDAAASTAASQPTKAESAAGSSRMWGLWQRSAPAGLEPQAETQTVTDQATFPAQATTKAVSAHADMDAPMAEAEASIQLQSEDVCKTESSSHNWSGWVPYWKQPPSTQAANGDMKAGLPLSVDQNSTPPLTPAEQVKADALARPDPPQYLSVGAREAVLNPATRSSWVSYFSSKGARPSPRIEASEPEVMEIDFGEDDPAVKTRDAASVARMPPASSKDMSAPGKPTTSSAMSRVVSGLRGAPSAPQSPLLKAVDSKSEGPSKPNQRPEPDSAPPAADPAKPLTEDPKKADEVVKKNQKPPKKGAARIPNLVLPTFEDTFRHPPRSLAPPAGVLKRTLSAVNAWLLSQPAESSKLRTAPKLGKDGTSSNLGLALAEEAAIRLPRSWEVIGHRSRAEKRGCGEIRKVVVVSLHGWFAQSWASKAMGEPTGTSLKFATEMRDAVCRHFAATDGMALNPEAITMMPVSAHGTVEHRCDRSFAALLSRKDWVEHLASADAIFFACHSQGCVVGAMLLARLIEQNLVHPKRTRIVLLGMCGVHAGPFEHLRSTVVGSYLNYFETAAAKELFDFQRPDSAASRRYEAALGLILQAGVKVLFVGSTDDQVVPLHSALFTAVDHPSILRALYIHGNTFPKLDFLTNMLIFCVKARNAGLPDHDLLALLSGSVAGSLYGGQGHSLCYEEPRTYDLAVQYLLQSTHPLSEPTTRHDELHPPKLQLDPFDSRKLANPHSLPWSLRGLLEDRAVQATFADDIAKLVDDFENWRPVTKTLRDVRYRLEPMRTILPRRRNASGNGGVSGSREANISQGLSVPKEERGAKAKEGRASHDAERDNAKGKEKVEGKDRGQKGKGPASRNPSSSKL